MYCFFKYFIIALVAQSMLLSLLISTGIGNSIVYLFYAIPYILLFPRNEANKIEISILFMAIIPSIIYAILFGLGVCLICKLRAKN